MSNFGLVRRQQPDAKTILVGRREEKIERETFGCEGKRRRNEDIQERSPRHNLHGRGAEEREKGKADLRSKKKRGTSTDRGHRQANHRSCVWAVVMYRRDGKGG